jgi:putative ABC transport system permease protein
MVSMGEGAKAKVAQTFSAMGTSTLVVSSGSSSAGGARGGAGSQPTITWDDVAAMQELPDVAAAAPQLRKNLQVQSEGANWQTSIIGTTADWFTIRNWSAESGELLTPADEAQSRKVAVLGRTVVTNLFGEGADPVGQTIRIDRTPFVIAGVLAKKGTSPMGSDEDDTIIVPASSFVKKLGSGGVAKYVPGQVLVSAVSDDRTQEAQAAIEETLRARHRIRGDDDFSVRDLSSIAAAQQESTGTITSLLAGVALVSLLVGGIGIMNIMLVSVTERTREIGIRLAIGTRGRDVLRQFLIEATVLSVIGGAIGVLVGIGAAKLITFVNDWPTSITFSSVLAAFLCSAAIGIFFGYYPARQAARLDPIQALRAE